MAIAFVTAADLGNNGGSTTSLTAAFDCAGGNYLEVSFAGDDTSGSDDVTDVTYAGVSMTFLRKNAPGSGQGAGTRNQYVYGLANPASGSNNVVITIGSTHYILALATSYSGMSASGQPDATNTKIDVTPITVSLTTVADNCWTTLLFGSYDANNPGTAGTGSTRRTYDATFGTVTHFDSNGPITPAGSTSMQATYTNNPINVLTVMVSLAPATVTLSLKAVSFVEFS